MPKSQINMTIILMLISFCQTNLSAKGQSNTHLEGNVEQHDIRRLIRPATPPSLSTKETKNYKNQKAKQGKTDKSALVLLNEKLSKADFDLSFDKNGKLEKTIHNENTSQDETDQDLIIAWSQWHKKFNKELYDRWCFHNNTTGQAEVTICVSKDGKIEFEINNFNSLEESYSGQELDFAQELKHSLASMENSSVLKFPEGSLRKKVRLLDSFTKTNGGGPSGYTWNENDVEHVHKK